MPMYLFEYNNFLIYLFALLNIQNLWHCCQICFVVYLTKVSQELRLYSVEELPTVHRPRADPYRGVNVLSAVRGKYKACRWTEDFVLISDKKT
jgi:hypothetical protein